MCSEFLDGIRNPVAQFGIAGRTLVVFQRGRTFRDERFHFLEKPQPGLRLRDAVGGGGGIAKDRSGLIPSELPERLLQIKTVGHQLVVTHR